MSSILTRIYFLFAIAAVSLNSHALSTEAGKLEKLLNAVPVPPSKCHVDDQVIKDYDNVVVLFEGTGGHNEQLDVALQKIMAQKPECITRNSPSGKPTYTIKFKNGKAFNPLEVRNYLDYLGKKYGVATPPGLKNFIFRQMCEKKVLDLSRTKILYYKEFQDLNEAAHCLQRVKAKLPQTKTIVMGYSLGGQKALDFANKIKNEGMDVDLGITVDPYINGITAINKLLMPNGINNLIGCDTPRGHPDHDPYSSSELNAPRGVKWLNFWQESDTRILGMGLRGFGVNNATHSERIHLPKSENAHWKIFESKHFEEVFEEKVEELLSQ